MSSRYEVPLHQVASRTLDGEAVVINLESGVYFGMNRPATALWDRLLAAPRSAAALAEALAAAHAVALDEVAVDVRSLLDVLEREGLLVATDAADTVEATIDPLGLGGPYVAPLAERYDRLDELMLSGE